jgi:Sulfotransferase family
MWEAGSTLPGDLTGPSFTPHAPRPAGTRRVPRLRALARAGIRGAGIATAGVRPLPDFLIIGAKRSGTTSLYRWLLGHPEVLPPFPAARWLPMRSDIKGVHHFDDARHGTWWYRSHFPTRAARALVARRTGTARVVAGEATPYYLHHPLAAARAAALVPDARLIALVRDPVERVCSHGKEQRRRGSEPLATFEAALDAEPERLAGEAERLVADPGYRSFAHEHQSYAATSRYLEPLGRWEAAFSPGQLLVLRSEDLFADPQATLDTVFDHLGVRRARLGDAQPFNRTAGALATGTRARLEAELAADTAALEAHLGRPMGWTTSRSGRLETGT